MSKPTKKSTNTKKKNWKDYLTFTNILIILAIIIYILNVFVVSPDTGSMALDMNEIVKEDEGAIFYLKLAGLWGGHLNELLSFGYKNVLAGEIWRIWTVVITHSHIAHLVMNLIALYIAGNHIEKKYGTKKTIILFLILTALNDFITDWIYFGILGNEYTLSQGASGWIMVLVGMIFAKCLLDKNYLKNELSKPGVIYLVIYFISTTFVLLRNSFTISAHVSGLVIGLIAELIIYAYCKNSGQKIKEKS